jgi:hypothetical protein
LALGLIIENELMLDGAGAPGRKADVSLAGKQTAAKEESRWNFVDADNRT